MATLPKCICWRQRFPPFADAAARAFERLVDALSPQVADTQCGLSGEWLLTPFCQLAGGTFQIFKTDNADLDHFVALAFGFGFGFSASLAAAASALAYFAAISSA